MKTARNTPNLTDPILSTAGRLIRYIEGFYNSRRRHSAQVELIREFTGVRVDQDGRCFNGYPFTAHRGGALGDAYCRLQAGELSAVSPGFHTPASGTLYVYG